AVEKLASFILMMADRRSSNQNEARIPMTRADIADYLGLTVETVSRTLTKLKQDGVIALPSTNCLELCDYDRLEDLAAGEFGDDFLEGFLVTWFSHASSRTERRRNHPQLPP